MVTMRECCRAVGRACAACSRRFEDLWRLRPLVVAFVRRHGADRHATDDVAADVFLVAWRRLDVVPHRHGEAAGWLCQTARHVLANHWRRAGRDTVRSGASIEQIGHEEPPSLGSAWVDRLDTAEAWRSLTTTDRAVLSAVALRGPTMQQLAQELSCTPAAAAQRLSRARQRLEDALA